MSKDTLVLGTRGSELALRQTEMVTEAILATHPHLKIERRIIHTAGDKRPDLRFSEFASGTQPIVDKGIFIKELEVALERGEIDAAVHSLKDVPSDLAPGFVIASVMARAAVEDVLITAGPMTLETLPSGARVGTSSVRRARQLQWLRPDLQIVEIRGNVPTRVRKVLGDNPLDAVLLAAAGLLRLNLLNASVSRMHIEGHTLHALALDPFQFLPAAGQGAVAVECRSGDETVHAVLRSINHAETEARVTAEREFLRLLGAGCQTPVGAHTWLDEARLHMRVRVFSEQDLTAPPVELCADESIHQPALLATRLVEQL